MSAVEAIKRSSHTFQHVVWPAISDIFGGAQIIPVETVTDSEMTRMLDVYAGVDMWMVLGDLMYPVASRVQYGPTAWDTFTVRYSLASGNRTEYQKRRESIDRGSLYPRITMQAYVHDDRLLSVGWIRTDTLINLCERHMAQIRTAPGGNQFIWVDWNQCDPGAVTVYRPLDTHLNASSL